MNASDFAFTTFGLILILAFITSLAYTKEQSYLLEQEDKEAFEDSLTRFQKLMLRIILACFALFSVSGIYLIGDFVVRLIWN